MKNQKRVQFLFTVLLLVALAMGVVLVQQSQELRKGAYFGRTAVMVKPTEFNVAVGGILPVQIWVVSEEEAKVDGVEAYICFGSDLAPSEEDVKKSVIPNQEESFNVVTLARYDQDVGCLKFHVGSMGTNAADVPSGAFKVATVNLRAVTQGTGTISIDEENTKVSGRNPNVSSNDTALLVTTVEGASYTITPSWGNATATPQPGTNTVTPQPTSPASTSNMWLNYRVAFAGVKADRQCATNWQTRLTALSGSIRREYASVPLTKTNSVNSDGEAIYEGSFQMLGFSQGSGVAVFFKGPKHLQVKYGKTGQTAVYNQAGGEISLTNVASTSPVLNFSEYPILAGDVNGDGMINGIDFTMVKPKAATFLEIASGGYLAEDLDGSCQVNNNDIILLVRSLNEKQDQVY